MMTGKTSIGILFSALVAVAAFSVSCGSSSQLPLDDAYYWPDGRQQASAASSVAEKPVTGEQAAPAPAYEILNEQDTTVTIRFNR